MGFRAIVLCASLSLPATADAAVRLLALPVVAEGVDARAVAEIQASLDDALSGLLDVERVAAGGPTFCAATDTRCIADAGARSGAAQVLHASARPVGDTISLLLVLVEGSTTRKATEALRPGVRAGPVVRSTVVRLVSPKRWVGSLQVDAVPGSELWVDGQRQGVAPSSAIAGLSPGLHLLRVTRADGEARSYVEIRFDEVTRVRVEPRSDQVSVMGYGTAADTGPQPAPSLAVTKGPSDAGAHGTPALLRWSLLGAGAASILAGVFSASHGQSLKDERDRLRQPDGTYPDPVRASSLESGYRESSGISTGLYIAGAVLTASAGVLFVLDAADGGGSLALRGAF